MSGLRLTLRLLVCASLLLPSKALAAESAPPVTYLSRAPVVNGVLDAELQALPARGFPVRAKSAPDNPDHDASYRIAYGAGFLYVYLEINADTFAYRDRAYQNGDGFTLVIAKPEPGDEPTREFFVLACSAVNRRDMEWSRRVFWYYNVSHIFVPVSDDTKLATNDGDGVVSFELLLPWKDVHPYHPWLSEGIGFNLGVVKAVGEHERNLYKVVDDNIGAENSPRRCVPLRFESPRPAGDPQTFVRLERNTIRAGETLHARAVTVASGPVSERLRVSLLAGEKTPVDYRIVKYDCGAGITTHDLTFDTGRQPPGGYVVKWRSLVDDSGGESGLSILPAFDADALGRRLDAVKPTLAPGSYTSLQFTIQEISSDLAHLHDYETAAQPRIKIERALACLDDADRGVDRFAQQRGFVRMAYRSALDGTLQPYVVRIPADFDPTRKYPLLVYLHGSAGDERDLMAIKTIPDGFIALGPRGRGPSNWYSWDDAQADIAEAVQAVKNNFPIDDDHVFLTGFSMGGYGVYRTYHESPATYCGIAIFSGSPKITFQVPEGMEALDFNDRRLVRTFQGVPVFVFHGRADMNVPYAETEQFVARLEKAGAKVEFHVEDNKGHEAAGHETVAAFFHWIEALRETSR